MYNSIDNTIYIVIIGTNEFDDYNFFEEKLYEKLNKYFEQNYKIVIREQESNMVDNFAVKFAKENNCELERYKIKWDILGKKAGFENLKFLVWGKEANRGADLLFTFQNKWDGEKSKYIIDKTINEFKSIINFDFFEYKNYYSFIR